MSPRWSFGESCSSDSGSTSVLRVGVTVDRDRREHQCRGEVAGWYSFLRMTVSCCCDWW